MIKSSYKGKFIVFDSLDGSGQSSQIKLLGNFLLKQGKEVVVTKEPTRDSEAGKKIREILDMKAKVEPKELQELFTQDRKEHLENLVIPALKEGKYVISDRYFFSTFAYGVSDGLDLKWLIGLNNDFLLPDLAFILKVRPEICLQRIDKRGDPKTLFEKKEKLAGVWETYEKFPSMFENVLIIDGEQSLEEVFNEVSKVVLLKFKEEN